MNKDGSQPRKRIFIYEFVWTEDIIRHVLQLCEQKNFEICGWAVRRKDIDRLTKVWPEVPLYESALPADLSLINFEADLLGNFDFEEEETLRFLLDREGEGGYQNNMHSNQARYEYYAWAKTVLDETQPDWMLFSDVPHNIFSYLLHLQGKQRGIQTLMLRMGLAPHIFTVSKEVERELLPVDLASENYPLSEQSNDFLHVLKHGSQNDPYYMKRQRKNSRPVQILKRALSKGAGLFTRKSRRAIVTHFKRRKLKKYYESVCEPNVDMSKPYIILFLHLQPERSTVPEGGIFAQQWLITQMLATACVPHGWHVFIKEHPSTFMTGPKLYRGNWFYDSLKRLPNVSLISTSIDSGTLLNNSRAVATVTGTVGIESVIKGIPALFFGETPRIGMTGTFRIKNLEDLKAAVAAIKEGVEIDYEDIKKFYSSREQDPTYHNTGLGRTADHASRWLNGIPQTTIFSKMIDIVKSED